MAKRKIACRDDRARWRARAVAAAAVGLAALAAAAADPAGGAPAPPLGAPGAVPPAASRPAAGWLAVPRVAGRLTARDIGLVINVDDPYSVQVGGIYAAARGLDPKQVLRVSVPLKDTLSPEEFEPLRAAIEAHFDGATQALALAWKAPYAVACNGITGALALGYDAELCSRTCGPSKRSPYFNARTARPFADLGVRPSMLIAAPDVAAAKALIARGVRADRSLGRRGAPPARAVFVVTGDRARNTRAPLYPPAGPVRDLGLEVHIQAEPVRDAERLLLVQTGASRLEHLDTLRWVPGALADHLTSFGGRLDGSGGQTSALAWIASGATASYGTVSEPCSHPQKFPHPQALLLHYVQGETALEAYWKSVAWPQQGVFVGEPLAAPFARR